MCLEDGALVVCDVLRIHECALHSFGPVSDRDSKKIRRPVRCTTCPWVFGSEMIERVWRHSLERSAVRGIHCGHIGAGCSCY